MNPTHLHTQVSFRYRYGFQGQESDGEVKGAGNSYTAEFWQYDSRLGRRWNPDPVVKDHESPYATYANNPIIMVDPNGKDTTIFLDIVARSAIEQREGDPIWVPAGTKLKSATSVIIQIKNNEIIQGTNGIHFEVTPTEYTSPVWEDVIEIDPAFTRVANKKISINGGKVHGSFDVETQLSGFEVVGQWVFGAGSGILQDNIITVRQSISFTYDLENHTLQINYDGSSFPQHYFDTEINVYEGPVGGESADYTLEKTKDHVTLEQSSYKDAVDSKKFRDRGHKQRRQKKKQL